MIVVGWTGEDEKFFALSKGDPEYPQMDGFSFLDWGEKWIGIDAIRTPRPPKTKKRVT